MTVRKVARREVRLDPDYDQSLEEELRRRDMTFAAWVREQIDQHAEERVRAERLRLVEELGRMNVDWGYEEAGGPDPATRLIGLALDESASQADPNE